MGHAGTGRRTAVQGCVVCVKLPDRAVPCETGLVLHTSHPAGAPGDVEPVSMQP